LMKSKESRPKEGGIGFIPEQWFGL
jgi:hypothetical protein